jgi:hypothetical protein
MVEGVNYMRVAQEDNMRQTERTASVCQSGCMYPTRLRTYVRYDRSSAYKQASTHELVHAHTHQYKLRDHISTTSKQGQQGQDEQHGQQSQQGQCRT